GQRAHHGVELCRAGHDAGDPGRRRDRGPLLEQQPLLATVTAGADDIGCGRRPAPAATLAQKPALNYRSTSAIPLGPFPLGHPAVRGPQEKRKAKGGLPMSLAGQGVVAIWNGIAPEGRTEFFEWHNREHMPERVGIPGFRRGRRYIARYGAPEFFTLYEAESPEVLLGQDYLNRLNNPTPWTQRVPPMFFRDTSRGVCRVKLSLGVGQGGYMLTLRFGAQDGCEGELEKYLRHSALPPLADIVSVVGVHLCIADKSGSAIETVE